jgi:hypothetical protein
MQNWTFPDEFEYKIIQKENDLLRVRCNLKNKEEVNEWVKCLGEKNYCGFIVSEEKHPDK